MIIDWNLILRIIIAGVLGGLIGIERELRAKEAGFRTHFIVALGSALFMIISQFAFEGREYDAARVAAQVVSGIGFIGAGVIIFQKNAIRGITTAAGLWVAAAIGLACGAGMYPISIAATLFTIICLEMMHFIHLRHGDKVVDIALATDGSGDLEAVLEALKAEPVEIESCTIEDGQIHISVRMKQKDYLETMAGLLSRLEKYKIEYLK